MPSTDNIRAENGYQKDAYTYYPVLIIGAGESGIAMGWRLKEKLGFDQFRIFDRQSGIGGPNFVKYLQRVAAKYKIVDKIQLNTDVTELRWLDKEAVWQVSLTHLAPGTGDLSEAERKVKAFDKGKESPFIKYETVRAKVVISCVGILVEPNVWPASTPGKDVFEGEIFHTARWRDDVDFKGKDVVVVGTGCSAAQVVSSLFEKPYEAKSVTQLMRTPPWVMPRLEEPFGRQRYARYAPLVFRYFPVLGYIFRVLLYLLVELIWATVFQQKNRRWRSQIEASTLARMHSIIPPEYHEIMTPKYSYGCKRRVFDSAWLQSMSKPNFRLTTQPLKKLEARGVILGSSNGTKSKISQTSLQKQEEEEYLAADIVVLANGFEATHWLHPLTVYGRNRRSIQDLWTERGGPQAYMGTAVDGFPNFFMTTGPNTANGHSSLILESENIAAYIGKIVTPVLHGDAIFVEAKKEAEIRWTTDVQRQLKGTVFPSCRSWYQDVNGWNSTMYP
ncbi:MAG: hypothetical protein Q9201_000479 [Fulgogasparrea decipioides]